MRQPTNDSARAMQGSVLLISLIFLVVIGMTAAVALRSALSNDKVVNNQRLEALAYQYAEMGLRYCEAQLQLPTTTVASLQAAHNASPSLLADAVGLAAATWVGTSRRAIVVVPAQVLSPAGSSITPPTPPECFAERVTLADGGTAYLVTARGFSPDWAQNAGGRTVAGSAVWLQSMLIIQ